AGRARETFPLGGTTMSNRVIYGVNEHPNDLAGHTVAQVRARYQTLFNMAPAAVSKAHVNGAPVEESYVLRTGDVLEFEQQSATRGRYGLSQDPGLTRPWSKSPLKAKASLRELEEVIRRCRMAVAIAQGSVSGHGSPVDQEFELGDMMRRCADLPEEANT